MKSFKKFLEENLIIQSLLEISGRNDGLYAMYPDQQSGAVAGFYGSGGITTNRRPVIFPPQRDPRPGERSPFLIYDQNGNIVGLDLNGDGQSDTDEELQEWIESGGLENIPSDWIGDQDDPYQRFILFLKSFYNVGQWVLPFGKIGVAASLISRILFEIIKHGSIILDFLDIQDLLTYIIANPNLIPGLYELLQEFIQYIGESALEILLQALAYYTNSGNGSENLSIPKQFYRHIPGSNPGGMWQLYRFNPATGTWEPFGDPITLDEYSNMCEQEGSNCAPLENPGDPFLFKPPLPQTLQTYELEPLGQSEIPINNHWNQTSIDNSSGSNTDPNPEQWQM